MGHISITKERTLADIVKYGYISTGGEVNNHPNMAIKTIADMFADVLAARCGDVVFPWVINDNDSKPKTTGYGFKHIFHVSGPLFTSKGMHIQ